MEMQGVKSVDAKSQMNLNSDVPALTRTSSALDDENMAAAQEELKVIMNDWIKSTMKQKHSQQEITEMGDAACGRRWFLRPDSKIQHVRAWLVLLLTLYNCLVIPFTFYETSFTRNMRELVYINYAVDAVFLIDLIMMFFTPFVNDFNTIIWDPIKIRQRYLRGYFWWDFIAAIPWDYLMPFIGYKYSSNGYQVARLNRVARFHRLYSDPLLESKSVILRTLRLSMMLLLLCHWAGSLFFALGYYQDNVDRWVGPNYYDIADSTFVTQYTSSLYFAIVTLLTVGYGDITPQTNVEKFVTTIAIVMGMLFYAVIFGNITLLISNMNNSRSAHRLQMDQLEALFLHYGSKFPSRLRRRLRRKMADQYKMTVGIDTDSVLNNLPQSARADTLVVIRSRLFASFPPFHSLEVSDFALVRDLVLGTYSTMFLDHEYVYRANEPASVMCFVGEGEVGTQDVNRNDIDVYGEGESFGGIELLLGHRRWTSAVTRRNSEIIFLSAAHYHKVVSAHHPKYHANFMKDTLALFNAEKYKYTSDAQIKAKENWEFLRRRAQVIGRREISTKVHADVDAFYAAMAQRERKVHPDPTQQPHHHNMERAQTYDDPQVVEKVEQHVVSDIKIHMLREDEKEEDNDVKHWATMSSMQQLTECKDSANSAQPHSTIHVNDPLLTVTSLPVGDSLSTAPAVSDSATMESINVRTEQKQELPQTSPHRILEESSNSKQRVVASTSAEEVTPYVLSRRAASRTPRRGKTKSVTKHKVATHDGFVIPKAKPT